MNPLKYLITFGHHPVSQNAIFPQSTRRMPSRKLSSKFFHLCRTSEIISVPAIFLCVDVALSYNPKGHGIVLKRKEVLAYVNFLQSATFVLDRCQITTFHNCKFNFFQKLFICTQKPRLKRLTTYIADYAKCRSITGETRMCGKD